MGKHSTHRDRESHKKKPSVRSYDKSNKFPDSSKDQKETVHHRHQKHRRHHPKSDSNNQHIEHKERVIPPRGCPSCLSDVLINPTLPSLPFGYKSPQIGLTSALKTPLLPLGANSKSSFSNLLMNFLTLLLANPNQSDLLTKLGISRNGVPTLSPSSIANHGLSTMNQMNGGLNANFLDSASKIVYPPQLPNVLASDPMASYMAMHLNFGSAMNNPYSIPSHLPGFSGIHPALSGEIMNPYSNLASLPGMHPALSGSMMTPYAIPPLLGGFAGMHPGLNGAIMNPYSNLGGIPGMHPPLMGSMMNPAVPPFFGGFSGIHPGLSGAIMNQYSNLAGLPGMHPALGGAMMNPFEMHSFLGSHHGIYPALGFGMANPYVGSLVNGPLMVPPLMGGI